MNILLNELSRLADSNTVGSESGAQYFLPVTLISAERTPGPNGSVYTLLFTKNVEQLYYIVTSQDNIKAWGSNIESSDGRSSLTFTCDDECKQRDTIDVLFTNSSRSFEVTVVLSTETQAAYQDRFKVPILEVHHAGDLVYDTGRNLSFDMSASYGDVKGFSRVSLSLDSFGVGWVRTPEGTVMQSEETQYLRTEDSVVTIATAVYNTSGFLNVSLTYTDPGTALVKKIKVQRTLVVRHRDQTGPYPEGYLTLTNYNDRYSPFSVSRRCQADQICTLSCSVIGEITEMQVLQQSHTDDEHWQPVENISEQVFDYSRYVEWSIQPNVTREDMRFKCLAFTETSNATFTTHVQFYSPEFYIDANRSIIHVEHDENPEVYNVTANCTIVGRPVSYAYLDLRFENNGVVHYHYDDRVQIVPISLEENVATTTTELNPQLFEQLSGALCLSGSASESNGMREAKLRIHV